MLDTLIATPIDAPLSQAFAWTDLLAATATPEPGMLAGLLGLAVLVCAAIAWLTPPVERARRHTAGGTRPALPIAAAEVAR